jgi:hypothetical protein
MEKKPYGLEILLATIAALIIGSYLTVATGKHLWPFGNSAVPAAYQADWSGSAGLPYASVPLDLTLGSGQVNDTVGQISTTHGCKTAVVLEQGGGPITLGLDSAGSSAVCRLLFEVFNHFTVALVGSDSLELSVTVDGETVSCYLQH